MFTKEQLEKIASLLPEEWGGQGDYQRVHRT